MDQDPRRWPAGAGNSYTNQYLELHGDEEVDSPGDCTIDGQRAHGTWFNSGAGQYVNPGLQTTDARAGPYPYGSWSNLQSPYHAAMGNAWSGLPGSYTYGEPQPETPESFRGTPQMPQEQGRHSPRSIDAEQGSDEEFTARGPSDQTMTYWDHGHHLGLPNDPSAPWSSVVDHDRSGHVERAMETTAQFESSFAAPPPASSGRRHKEKNHGQASGADARRDGRQSGSKGSKSKSHKPHDERRRSKQ